MLDVKVKADFSKSCPGILLNHNLFISFQGYVQKVWEAMLITLTDEEILQQERKNIKDMTPKPMNAMLTKQTRGEAIKKREERKLMVTKDVRPTAGLLINSHCACASEFLKPRPSFLFILLWSRIFSPLQVIARYLHTGFSLGEISGSLVTIIILHFPARRGFYYLYMMGFQSVWRSITKLRIFSIDMLLYLRCN